ncbi:MAG: hypothetical protein H0A76_05785 [Candidatus Thiodubiliella endoseptemdiera]|uniref:Uncharacterized protein n=1 Tax=Candidatus Thiodubiliella endoseptemdiera TaxID=2738886 RepID=A0A853F4D4_9GAMM|nr:hypothetical protein [Candidatus Thiodubiliella endoseptemdiera]
MVNPAKTFFWVKSLYNCGENWGFKNLVQAGDSIAATDFDIDNPKSELR